MKKCTIREVAERASVSPATVSRVLNSRAPVSDELSDRVIRAASALGYTAPERKRTKSRLIGVLVPRLVNPFYSEILQGILDTAGRHDYDVIFASTSGSTMTDTIREPGIFHGGNEIAGLISLALLKADGWFLRSLPRDLPIVQCCEYNEDLPYSIVSIDHYRAAYGATEYLIHTGHRKLAMFNSTCNTLYGRERERGFRAALAAHDLPVREDWILHLGDVDYGIAVSAVKDMFADEDRPDSIFTVSDLYAAGIIKGVAQFGLRVPRDVSVIGFDDTEVAIINEPPLTTVRQPRYRLGAVACEILLRGIQSDNTAPQNYPIDSELIIRESTRSRLDIAHSF